MLLLLLLPVLEVGGLGLLVTRTDTAVRSCELSLTVVAGPYLLHGFTYICRNAKGYESVWERLVIGVGYYGCYYSNGFSLANLCQYT